MIPIYTSIHLWGCPKSNEHYTKCGGFDKLNHRYANLLDSLINIPILKSVANMKIDFSGLRGTMS